MFNKKIKKPSLKASIVGMNDRAMQMFTMFLEGPAQGSFEVVHDGSHEVVIIDLDGVDSPHLWLDVRRKFHGPVIVLSVTEKQLNNAFWVSKPVCAEYFLPVVAKVRVALESQPVASVRSSAVSAPNAAPKSEETPSVSAPATAGTELHAAAGDEQKPTATSPAAQLMSEEMDEKAQNCCGNLLDETYTDPRSQDEVFFDPAVTLLGSFREAMKLTAEAGIAKVEGMGAYPLFVGASENFVSTAMHEPYLRAVCVRTTSASPISVVLSEQEAKLIGKSEDPRLRRLDDMLWKISLWSSRGRVPHGTSLTAPVRLRSWPNIPRLMTVPHGMRIAALWVNQPSGLLETAQKLGVHYRFVFAFYCACQSFDLIEQRASAEHASASHPEAVAKPVTTEKRGLFGNLLKKLGLG